MCDSYVALSDISAVNAVVLGKNSDRPSFDCQPLVYHERKYFAASEKLNLAYIAIDQVEERYATIGSSPYWCWGYEVGFNEFGVAIGNEAIYTKDLEENAALEKKGIPVTKGIIGMELLRLGLERGKTAKEALGVIAGLVEEYGQWGSGVPMSDTVSGSYNNSFIIADSKEAYILETAGKKWAVRNVKKGYAAISNEVSIRTDMTDCCKDLVAHAIEKKWWPKEKEELFDFAAAYIQLNKPRQVSHIRVQRILQLLKQGVDEQGKVNLKWLKRILRDHYEDTFLEGPYFNAANPDFLTVCMHHSQGDFTWGNTASSSLFVLPDDENRLAVMWWAPVVPCCSVYIPIFVESNGLSACLSKAGTYGKTMCAPSDVKQEDTYTEESFWWEMRSLLDLINGDVIGSTYEKRHAIVRERFDLLEVKWSLEMPVVEAQAIVLKKERKMQEMSELLYHFTENCVNEALAEIKKVKEIFAI